MDKLAAEYVEALRVAREVRATGASLPTAIAEGIVDSLEARLVESGLGGFVAIARMLDALAA